MGMLAEELMKEHSRVSKAFEPYKKIKQAGAYGAFKARIDQHLNDAAQAAKSGNADAMMAAYNDLKEINLL